MIVLGWSWDGPGNGNGIFLKQFQHFVVVLVLNQDDWTIKTTNIKN